MLTEFEFQLLNENTDNQILIDIIKTLNDHVDQLQDSIAELNQELNKLINRIDNI